MAQEIIREGYYAEDLMRWIDIHQSAKICLEDYLSKVLFRGDLSRVQFSLPDMSFRRRTELMDTEKTENVDLSPVSLNLPYASYYQSADWDIDDRFASLQPGQLLVGEYDPISCRYIRSRAVKSTYKATAFFSRRDDVRMADQILGWEASPQGDARYIDYVEWRGNTLGIPINIRIEKVNTSPDYKEIDFLTKSRIFPIEIEFTIRSYQVHINKSGHNFLPVRFPNYQDHWEPGDQIYLTEKTTLTFASKKFDINIDSENVDLDDKLLNYNAPLFFDKQGPFNAAELRAFASSLPNDYTRDILRGYFAESSDIKLNLLRYNELKSTPESAYIDIILKPSSVKNFDRAKLLIPNHGVIEWTDCTKKYIEVKGLYPNSTYNCKLLLYSTFGNIQNFNLSFTTKTQEGDTTPNPEKPNGIPGLVGMSF